MRSRLECFDDAAQSACAQVVDGVSSSVHRRNGRPRNDSRVLQCALDVVELTVDDGGLLDVLGLAVDVLGLPVDVLELTVDVLGLPVDDGWLGRAVNVVVE